MSEVVLTNCKGSHWLLSAVGSIGIALTAGGCGSGDVVPNLSPPTITQQPSDTTSPLGSKATFVVTANGSGNLTYQWYRSGLAIPSSASTSYVVPAVSPGDDGANFSVQVSNRYGSVLSRTATLGVGPRAPDPLDLRFQQVDSPSTFNGYHGNGGAAVGNLLPLGGLKFPYAIGTPLSVGPGCQYGGTVLDISDCGWVDQTFAQPAGTVRIDTSYQSYRFSQWPAIATQVSDLHSVITGLDLAPAFDSCAIGWATAADSSNYDLHIDAVTLADVGSAIALDAANGRVTTAISFNGGQLSYISYGWSGDKTGAYEAAVAFTSKQSVANAAQSLAKSGFIITAVGGNDLDGVLLVGTRVKGDILARPIMIIPGGLSAQPLLDGGYAIVAVVQDKTGFIATIGER